MINYQTKIPNRKMASPQPVISGDPMVLNFLKNPKNFDKLATAMNQTRLQFARKISQMRATSPEHGRILPAYIF